MESGVDLLKYTGLFIVLGVVSVIVAQGIAIVLVKTTDIDLRIYTRKKSFVTAFFSAVLVFATLMVLSLIAGFFLLPGMSGAV